MVLKITIGINIIHWIEMNNELKEMYVKRQCVGISLKQG